jgi:bifunctional non-homologous end joining protein LigD
MPRVQVGERNLDLGNLDKVLYPETGFTKAGVIDYYTRIAPVMLSHLAGRPLSLRRCPDGVDADCFFEKRCPGHHPDWLPVHRMRSERSGHIGFCGADDLPALVWLANQAVLEIHPYLHLASAPECPTALVFDLDPGPPAGLAEACRVGLLLRGLLAEMGLDCLPKTSGGKGLHLVAPLNTEVTHARTKRFARAVAETLTRDDPARVTATMAKAERAGKVFIDWSQNDAHKTTVAVYSLRIGPVPRVSAPVTWDELESALADRDTDRLRLGPDAVLARADARGDLFQPVLTRRQRLQD